MTTEQSASMDAALNDVFSPGRGRHEDIAQTEAATPIEPPATVTPEATPQAEAEREDPVDHNKQVSVKEVFDEREKKRAYKAQFEAEKLRAATFEAELRALKEHTQQLLQTVNRSQPTAAPVQQRQPVQAPDPWQDPEGAIRHAVSEVQRETLVRELNKSERQARREHGAEVVEAAKQTAIQLGIITQFRDTLEPYEELVQWHKRYQAMQEVGNDLPSFKQKLEAEVRAKVLEELKAGKAPVTPGGQAQPAPQTFPGTLAAATQTGSNGVTTKTLEAATGDVFATDRKARGNRR